MTPSEFIRKWKDVAVTERAAAAVADFLGYLGSVRVLDPAGGSGNFLYVTLQEMKALEKEAVNWAADRGLQPPLSLVHRRQFFCIDVNPYACELAQMTLWIAYLQWIRANGLGQANSKASKAISPTWTRSWSAAALLPRFF